MLNAAVQTVAADGVIQDKESELLRAMADALGCPTPPMGQN
jgi:tellurite resistance protein